jgi:UDP-glucose 4-epimerase/UDP-glucuronate decarboxylase
MRRILITGGAGFMGYHLARELALEGDNDLTLVDNLVRGRKDEDLEALLGAGNVRLLAGDLTEPATIARLGGDYDEVYHLAAILGVENVLQRPQEVVRINAIATLLVLDWYVHGGGKRLLFSSTSEVYAWTQSFFALPIPTPEDVPLALTDLDNPRSSYAGSKIFGELSVVQYCGSFARPFSMVRYHNVYGPRMGHEHVIPQLYQRALTGSGPLTVYSADHRRAFCYVSDAVTATIAAMRSPAAVGRTFNVGSDTSEVSIAELARLILERAGRATDITPAPAVNDPILRRCPDISAARRLLGYEPKVSLAEGLDLTLPWYRKHYAAARP